MLLTVFWAQRRGEDDATTCNNSVNSGSVWQRKRIPSYTHICTSTHTHRHARIWMHALGAHIFTFSTSLSHSYPHMHTLKLRHMQFSVWSMKTILSHLKTIITAGWQNAAIYTKRSWLLSTFTASLTLSLLMCQVVEAWNNWPPPLLLIHLSNHPSILRRHFHHKQPSRSRWESESLVWVVLSG